MAAFTTPLFCAMQEWQVYSTRDGRTVPDSFIVDLYEIIMNLTTTGKIATLLDIKKRLQDHVKDSDAHAMTLKDVYPVIYDQLYRLYREYHIGTMDDMCDALFQILEIAEWGEVLSQTEDTKAVLAQHAHLLGERHMTDLNCHKGTFLQQFPATTVKSIPSVALYDKLMMTEYYKQYLGADGIVAYPVARKHCNEAGTFVFSVQYKKATHSTILFSLLDNGIERFRVGTLEAGGLYFDVVRQLEDGVSPSRIIEIPEPIDIPDGTVIHRKLAISYDQAQAYFRGTLLKRTIWHPVGHTFHGDTLYVRNLINTDIYPHVRSVVYYPTTIQDDETLIFLVD